MLRCGIEGEGKRSHRPYRGGRAAEVSGAGGGGHGGIGAIDAGGCPGFAGDFSPCKHRCGGGSPGPAALLTGTDAKSVSAAADEEPQRTIHAGKESNPYGT